MLQHLTAYLLQYKSLNIPGAAGFRLVQHAPQFNVADRCIVPPSYAIEAKPEEEISRHQLRYLQAQSGLNEGEVLHRLEALAEKIRKAQNEDGFVWEGLGTLKNTTDSFFLRSAALQPLSAEKIIRHDAAHNVLIGDRQTNTAQLADEKGLPKKSRRQPVAIIVAWVLLALAILFIAIWLYRGRFHVNAAGNKLPLLGQTFLLQAGATA